MNMIMHSFVFVPAVVFCTVAAFCWSFCAVLDWRGGQPAAARSSAPPVQRGFRPVVIQGGAAGAAISSLRVPQRPLGLNGAGTNIGAARSYGG